MHKIYGDGADGKWNKAATKRKEKKTTLASLCDVEWFPCVRECLKDAHGSIKSLDDGPYDTFKYSRAAIELAFDLVTDFQSRKTVQQRASDAKNLAVLIIFFLISSSWWRLAFLFSPYTLSGGDGRTISVYTHTKSVVRQCSLDITKAISQTAQPQKTRERETRNQKKFIIHALMRVYALHHQLADCKPIYFWLSTDEFIPFSFVIVRLQCARANSFDSGRHFCFLDGQTFDMMRPYCCLSYTAHNI